MQKNKIEESNSIEIHSSRNEIWLDWPQRKDRNASVFLYNTSGKLIIRDFWDGKSNQKRIEAKSMIEGIYFLKMKPNNGVPIFKRVFLRQ